MSSYFIFRFQEADENRKSLVVFSHSDFEVSSLTKVIKEDVEENFVPQRIFLMAFNLTQQIQDTLCADEFFIDEINTWIGDFGSKVSFLNVAPTGQIDVVGSDSAFSFSSEVLNAGAETIFENRKGLITSLPSYHFLKPSGDHCDKFIRASNLFTSGVEVVFLAIGLLPYLTSNIKRVYVDSSSISFLVSIALQLSRNFNDSLPIIESFESYSVFNKPYSFHQGDDSLVVISATTSGGLASTLTQKHTFKDSNIVTLFFSNIKQGQNSLYDISKVTGGITSVKPSECKLCSDGSKLIKIEGEQFIPETPKHELLVIRKVDFNESRQNFFKAFATRNLLKFDIAPCENFENEHFYVDVDSLLKLDEGVFNKALIKKVNKHFSKDIKKIICLDDDDALARKVVEIADVPTDYLVCYKDVSEEELKDHSSVMVIASAITSGRKLLATARKLRGIKSTATITYLVGFSKLPSFEAFEQLRKDLCLGGHELVPLQTCYLPRQSEKALSPWDIELGKLQQFEGDKDDIDGTDVELPQVLQSRLDTLVSPSHDDKLFIDAPTGNPLALRGTFAFWAGLGIKTEDSTQADVYWTIQSILHDLRLENDKGLATTYHSTLLSPVCFDRFNDGVIQACLLRSAKPTELNYAVDENFSRQITDIIISVISNSDNAQGEGCLEFLMALWCGRLKVQDEHLKEIVGLQGYVASEDVIFILNELDTK